MRPRTVIWLVNSELGIALSAMSLQSLCGRGVVNLELGVMSYSSVVQGSIHCCFVLRYLFICFRCTRRPGYGVMGLRISLLVGGT